MSWECRFTAQTEAERQQEDLPTVCRALAAVDMTSYDNVRFKPLNSNWQVFYMTYKEGTRCPKTVRTLCSLSGGGVVVCWICLVLAAFVA